MHKVTNCIVVPHVNIVVVTEDGKIRDVVLSDVPDVYAIRNIRENEQVVKNGYQQCNKTVTTFDIIHRPSTVVSYIAVNDPNNDIIKDTFNETFVKFAEKAPGLSYDKFKAYMTNKFAWLMDRFEDVKRSGTNFNEIRPQQCVEETKKKVQEITQAVGPAAIYQSMPSLFAAAGTPRHGGVLTANSMYLQQPIMSMYPNHPPVYHPSSWEIANAVKVLDPTMVGTSNPQQQL